ncbi:MAG: hypothetical protein Q8R92_11775, partial [Deltaproteobacteria bacterium]|nr:hypothetical protein [Deltaproteobacteria bacterium]
MTGLSPIFEPLRKARRATTHPSCMRPDRRAAPDAGEAAWVAFLAEARAALEASGNWNGKNGRAITRRFAASLAARFGACPESPRGRRRASTTAADEGRHVRAWLGGWIFVRHDASADPAA